MTDRLSTGESVENESIAKDGAERREALRAEYAQQDGKAGGAIGGAAVGAGLGVIVAGPVGAAVGVLVGAIAGEVAGVAAKTQEQPGGDDPKPGPAGA